MIFDSHAHLLSDDPVRYPPSPLSGVLGPNELDNPVTAAQLLEMMDRQGVQRAVAVQRAHVYGFNNAYVLDSAEQHPERLAAVCMLNGLDASSPGLVRHWVRARGAVGIRMTEPSKGADPSWFSNAQAQQVWRAAIECGVGLRLHLYRWNRAACLPVLSGLLEQYPAATVIVDHLSNITVEAGAPDHGVDALLLDLVRFPNVHLLFSAINLARLKAAGLPAAPVIARVVQSFGSERVFWGSDVGQSKGTYDELVGMAREAVSGLTPAQQQRVLHDNAARLCWRS